MNDLYEGMAFVVYPVADPTASAAFYADVLELVETERFGNSWIEFAVGGGTLALTNTFPHLVPGAPGAILAIEVTDLDTVDAALRRKNLPWATGPFDTPECRGGSIRDPDGNELILHQKKIKGA